LPYQGIPYCDAGTLQAKVESQYRDHAQAVAQTRSQKDLQQAVIKLRCAMRRLRRTSGMPRFSGQSVRVYAQQVHRSDEA
jgi:hypothetical protein